MVGDKEIRKMEHRRGVKTLSIVIVVAGAIAAYAKDESSAERKSWPAVATALDTMRARWASDSPYGGNGRYSMLQEDGMRDVQGLFTLAKRHGAKPYKELSTENGGWLSERVVFKDVDTAATIVRYTNDPFTDQLSYFQGNWSADGKYIVFRRRPGMWQLSTATHGPMAIDANGTNLRNVFRGYRDVREQVCSPTLSDVCYAEADGSRVVAFDIASGEEFYTVREVPHGWHMKISPDGYYLMNRAETSKGKGLWIASVDGSEFYEIALPEAIHDSYRFHPSVKKIIFWYEGRFRDEGFVQSDFSGTEFVKVGVPFDWNHGDFGTDRGVHENGFIVRAEGDAWSGQQELFHKPGVEYYDIPHHYNGYISWWPKDQLWACATRIVERPYISELQSFPAEPSADGVVNRYRICCTALKKGYQLDCPNTSPDGTKVLFNSNCLGANNIFGVVARLPEAPTDLQATWTAEGLKLTWKPPKHHAEIAGYRVYGSRTGGSDFVSLTGKLVTEPSLTLRTNENGKEYFYAVSAVEHSGLESGLSIEASPRGDHHRRRIYLEVDHAARSPEMWLAFHGEASDLHYVWMRKESGEGAIRISLNEKQTEGLESAIVWARVKGVRGAEFAVAVGGHCASIETDSQSEWTWVKAESALPLSDANEIVLSSARFGSAIDCLWITNDDAFEPSSVSRIVTQPLSATEVNSAVALSPYSVKVTWRPCTQRTFQHYNVYCGTTVDFTPDQSTLVSSPERAMTVDWGLSPGTQYYYRVTCVDRFGKESIPSQAWPLKTPAIDRVCIEKEFAEELLFEAPKDDTYVVWLLLKKTGGDGGEIEVKCHRALRQSAGSVTTSSAALPLMKGGGTWAAALDGLSDVAWLSYDQWGRFDLERGSYVFRFERKTRLEIEKVCITNDQSYQPPGHINILTGW